MAGPATVEEYLAACPEDSRVALENLRAIVKAIAPDATDTISYQMPAIRHNGVRARLEEHAARYRR